MSDKILVSVAWPYANADIHVGNILEMGSWMRSFYPQRGFGRDFRVQRGDHWLVPGIEDPRGLLGHAIGLNLAARVRSLQHYTLHDWWANEIHKQGGLYGHTHVGEQALMVEREVALLLLKGLSTRDIADLRETREATVRQQAQGVYRKAQLEGRAELAAFFLEDLLAPNVQP